MDDAFTCLCVAADTVLKAPIRAFRKEPHHAIMATAHMPWRAGPLDDIAERKFSNVLHQKEVALVPGKAREAKRIIVLRTIWRSLYQIITEANSDKSGQQD